MMETTIQGTMRIFGNNIDTDQIYPGCYLELTDPQAIASHCLEGADPEFGKRYTQGDIIVAGTNFGCGSSREHAAIALKTRGVGAVLAKSFARIFYRNGINMGLPLVVCPQLDAIAGEGEAVTIDLSTATAVNQASGARAAIEPISPYAMEILAAGGIKALMRAQEC